MMKLEKITLPEVLARLEKGGSAIGLVDPQEYHAWKSKLGPCVASKSSLHEFDASNYDFDYHRRNGTKKESSGFKFGSAVDALALTPELFCRDYVCEEINARTKEGKARKAELEAEGKTNLTPEEKKLVYLAAANLLETWHARENPFFADDADEPGFRSQVAMFARVESFGAFKLAMPIVLTGMIDILPDDSALGIWDVKTTRHNVENEKKLRYDFLDFGYHLQAALYLDLFQLCTGQKREDFSFLFVESALPCKTRVVHAGASVIERGRAEYMRIAAEYAEYCTACQNGKHLQHEVEEMTIEI